MYADLKKWCDWDRPQNQFIKFMYFKVLFIETWETEEPEDGIGMHCFEPYECGFFKHCAGELPIPNIFDIHGLPKKKMFDCYNDGIISFEQLSNCDRLSQKQYMQVEYSLFHYKPHIEKEAIRRFLDTLSYPLYFLDFETFQPAVPLYDNSKPYQQIAFQYSLHYTEEKSGEIKHKEYLAFSDWVDSYLFGYRVD